MKKRPRQKFGKSGWAVSFLFTSNVMRGVPVGITLGVHAVISMAFLRQHHVLIG